VASDRCERTAPEHLADHGRVLEQALLVRGKEIEACGNDPLNRLRQPKLAPVRALGQHPAVLLGVQRVSACPGEQRRLRLRQQNGAIGKQADQPRGLLIGQW